MNKVQKNNFFLPLMKFIKGFELSYYEDLK